MSAVAQKEKDKVRVHLRESSPILPLIDIIEPGSYKGNAAFKAGDYPTAIGHYTAASIADPANGTYPLNRAAAYLKLGKNEDAERDCDTVLRIDRKNVKGYFRRGQARVALQKLREAEADFRASFELEPANDAVKQELKKVQDALKATLSVQKTTKPIDVSTPLPTSTATPPKRRRVPIAIVEPEPAPVASSSSAATTQASSKDTGLLTPVSSRPLSRSTSPSSQESPNAQVPSSAGPSTHPKPASRSFKEAKAAREEARPRGGIFRSDGRTSLFYASSPSNGDASVPKRETPQTLVAFMKIWETLSTEEERWDVLRQIPATRLPVLFKTSLDAAILGSILRSLRTAITAAPGEEERARIVRAYMVNLPRVPRFNTVSMMMDASELGDAQVIWDLLGRSRGDGVEGEMDKRKEDGSRRAWGCH
ncbi:hypothetical protein C8Q74DRAFT_1227804 [Fomes fomentarius]|nr:hypothetical protein C8Q74DRAFT_1227804 [Fomes fomentarius]